MSEVVEKFPEVFFFASKEIKQDRDFVMAAVSRNWEVFKYCADDMKADRDIIIEAFKGKSYQSGEFGIIKEVWDGWKALEFAASSIRGDQEVLKEAIVHDWRAFKDK